MDTNHDNQSGGVAPGRDGRSGGAVKFAKGDLVRVVTPLAFVRCGYPLDPAEVQERMAREHRMRICEFLNLSGQPLDADAPYYQDWIDPRALRFATRALASQHLAANNFGGNKRTIHTQELPEIKGKVFKVTGWQFNKTGDYYPPWHGGGGYDPVEYEPGGLMNEKTHRILHLEYTDGTYRHLKIEACHVEKVTDASDRR